MSIQSRLLRGDNVDDVKALFPHQTDEVDRLVSVMKKPAKKKAAKKKAK